MRLQDGNGLSRQRFRGLRTSKTLIVENLISFLVNRMFDPAPAQDAVSVIKNDGLARSDSALRFVEVKAGAAVGQRPYASRRRLMPIANLDRTSQRSERRT